MKHALLCCLLVACGGSKTTADAGAKTTTTTAAADAGAAPTTGTAPVHGAAMMAAMGADGGVALAPAKQMDIGENELTESDRNRDPFKSYATMFVEQAHKPAINQRTVLLSQYALDELKLVGIVQAGDYPRAMLVDPTKKGWIVKKGDFIGRPDVVHVGGSNGSDFQLNWRVDRVRDGDIVLSREDPVQRGAAPATRVIPLRSEQEETNPLLQKTN